MEEPMSHEATLQAPDLPDAQRAMLQELLSALGAHVERLADENAAMKAQLTQQTRSGSKISTAGVTRFNSAGVTFQETMSVASNNSGAVARGETKSLDQLAEGSRKLEAEEQYEALYDLSRAFHVLCARDRASISVEELVDMTASQTGLLPTDDLCMELADQMQAAIKALNLHLGIMAPKRRSTRMSTALSVKSEVSTSMSKAKSERKEPAKDIALDTFIAIMHRKSDFFGSADPEVVRMLTEARDTLVKEDALRKVAKATKMSFVDISRVQSHRENTLRDFLMKRLDPLIGVMIVLNALVICVSTDFAQDSAVWQWAEVFFTVVFLVEVLIKLRVFGLRNYFFSPDKFWNQFDFLVVVVATIDMLLAFVLFFVGGTKAQDLGDFTIIRLLRFMRLTKLVRVLKLKVFHELTLMINGILAGVRTLLWAVVFLGFVLAILGVLITQLAQEGFETKELCEGKEGVYKEACDESAEHLSSVREQLFGSVLRSVFTVFRCITDGCASTDGTPLMPYFYNTHGHAVVFFYMVVTLFVMFGLFNLIMAIFVENTIANAGAVEAKRHEAKHLEHLRVARKLQDVIVMFCVGEEAEIPASKRRRSPFRPSAVLRRLRGIFATAKAVPGEHKKAREESEERGNNTANLSLTVSHETFDKMMERDDVQDMLDELDIGASYRPGLFEILDANNNGMLEVSELVQGLLKLRGPLNKGESVAALLAIRSMQKSMKSMQVLGLHQQHAIEALAESIELMPLSKARAPRRPSTTSFRRPSCVDSMEEQQRWAPEMAQLAKAPPAALAGQKRRGSFMGKAVSLAYPIEERGDTPGSVLDL